MPTICAVAASRHTAVHRQDYAGNPGGIGEVEHGVRDVCGRAVAAERLHVMETVKLGFAELAVQGGRDDAGCDCVDADVVHRRGVAAA